MKVNKLTTTLLIIIALLIALLIITSGKNTPEVDPYASEKQVIDSLSGLITNLDKEHIKQDSIINSYKIKIESLEYKVDSTKNKITEIRNYYGKKIKDISNYTNDELDSFFTERYSK
jgi:hypothetical protein